jgi:hypothetical protein
MRMNVMAFGCIIAALALPSAAMADECLRTGRMSIMLMQVEEHCPRYRLTTDGRRAKVALIQAAQQARSGDVYLKKARPVVFEEFATRTMERLLDEGDKAQFEALLCEEIITYLGRLGKASGQPKLYERK